MPSQSPPWAAVYRAQPSITEDRAAIAGRAAVGAALSCLAVVGCCNPLGWFALLASLRAYANTGDADLGPAAVRAERALRLSWWAFGSTTALWVVGIAAWWFNPA
ncbi:MAG: CD225/dispanin family protein [Polyangiales bacterium]